MLEGIRILDLTWVLGGPFAGQLLAQLGAEVIKVEAPAGDMARTFPPVYFEGDSSFFLSVNRGKKSVCIDLKHPEGKAAFDDLVRESDAVIHGFSPEVPKRLGIDIESLRRINPKICVGQLIGLHDEGGYSKKPAFDIVVQALSGIMGITGHPNTPPVRIGNQVADIAGGLYLALGTLGALLRAARTGVGDGIQVSLLDCQLAMLTWQAQNYLISGVNPSPKGSRHPTLAPSEVFQGQDGKSFVISPTGQRFWLEFCDAIDRPDLAKDHRFLTPEDRYTYVEKLAEELGAEFANRSAEDWLAQFDESRIPAAPVLDVEQALRQPLAMLRSMVEMVSHPSSGAQVEALGNPFKTDSGSSPLSYPPKLGEHTDELLHTLCGYSDQKIENLIMDHAVFSADSTEDPQNSSEIKNEESKRKETS